MIFGNYWDRILQENLNNNKKAVDGMRDRKNIICDVNNARYQMYNESSYNFEGLNKKQLLTYLFKLIENTNKFIEKSINENNRHNLRYHQNNLSYPYSFNYAYKIFNKQQIKEGITTILFTYNEFLKSNKI